jgi:hypothetical protein
VTRRKRDRGGFHFLCHCPLKCWRNRAIIARDDEPGGLGPPCCRGDFGAKGRRRYWPLGRCHCRLFGGRKVLREAPAIPLGVTVRKPDSSGRSSLLRGGTGNGLLISGLPGRLDPAWCPPQSGTIRLQTRSGRPITPLCLVNVRGVACPSPALDQPPWSGIPRLSVAHPFADTVGRGSNSSGPQAGACRAPQRA